MVILSQRWRTTWPMTATMIIFTPATVYDFRVKYQKWAIFIS